MSYATIATFILFFGYDSWCFYYLFYSYFDITNLRSRYWYLLCVRSKLNTLHFALWWCLLPVASKKYITVPNVGGVVNGVSRTQCLAWPVIRSLDPTPSRGREYLMDSMFKLRPLMKNDSLLVVRLLHSDKNYPLNVENDSDKNLFANNELISG